MFWTAFVWGVGVSCGSALGLLTFFVFFWTLEWMVGRSNKFVQFNKESLEALRHRNELTGATNVHLDRLADAVVYLSTLDSTPQADTAEGE